MVKKKKQSSKQPSYLGTNKERFEMLLEEMNSKFDVVLEHTKDIQPIKERLENIEEDIRIIKLDIEFIKNDLKQKVNREEFAALEKRLSLLENKFRASL